MQDIKELCAVVRQTAYNIHLYLGHGHLETDYRSRTIFALSAAISIPISLLDRRNSRSLWLVVFPATC